VEWRDDLREPLAGRYHGAFFEPSGGSLQPARWVRRLAALAVGAGADLREHEPVGSLTELEADQVVLATDGYTRGLLPELDAVVVPARGQVLMTEPLPRRLFPCPHYARHGHEYWQQTPDSRLVAGGFRDKALEEEETMDEVTTPLVQGHLEQFVNELTGAAPQISQRWAGIFGVTEDRIPLAGQVSDQDGVWVACGYSGHGNVLGLTCGELVAHALLGSSAPELELFDPSRLLKR
jgi:glycine/D-amino acid oxidase-like deaminating enzyme